MCIRQVSTRRTNLWCSSIRRTCHSSGSRCSSRWIKAWCELWRPREPASRLSSAMPQRLSVARPSSEVERAQRAIIGHSCANLPATEAISEQTSRAWWISCRSSSKATRGTGASSTLALFRQVVALIGRFSLHVVPVLTLEICVQVPSCATLRDVVTFLADHDADIRQQRERRDADCVAFANVADRCVRALGLASLSYAERVDVADAVEAAQALLRLATTSNTAHQLHEVAKGSAICFDHVYGMGQDGQFTLPVDWR